MAISLKCTRFTVKENLLLFKGLSKLWRVRSINIWLRFPKNVYNNKLDEIVNKYNNTHSKTIKIKHDIDNKIIEILKNSTKKNCEKHTRIFRIEKVIKKRNIHV